jgi:hypothetical protein
MKALAIMLTMFAPAVTPLDPPFAAQRDDAMKYACEALAYDCNEVPVPRIVFHDLRGSHGTVGKLHNGEWVVVLNTALVDDIALDARPSLAQAVLIHETVHYLDVVLGVANPSDGDGWTAEEVCASEARAWHVANLYWIEHGLSENARWNWRSGYPHCQE